MKKQMMAHLLYAKRLCAIIMKKQVFIWCLPAVITLVFLLSAFYSPAAYADAATLQKDGFTYSVNEDGQTVTLEGYDSSEETDFTRFTIPGEMDGMPVTALGYAFMNRLKSYAAVVIPKEIQNLDEAFVTFYGDTMFEVDSESQYFMSEDGAVYDKDKTALFFYPRKAEGVYVIPESVTYIKKYAFYESKLDQVIMSDNVESIGTWAFQNASIRSVQLSDNLKTLDYGIFSGCHNLQSIEMPEGLQEINDYAFSGCGLASVTLPANVKKLGNQVFDGCTSLSSVQVLGKLEEVGSNILEDTAWIKNQQDEPFIMLGDVLVTAKNQETSVKVPDKTRVISRLAFRYLENAVSIDLPSSVQFISDEAFDDCSKLEQINVSEDNPYFMSKQGILYDKNITALLFIPENCTGSITIPASLTDIHSGKFYGRSSLSIIVLQDADMLGVLGDIDSINKLAVILDADGNLLDSGSKYQESLQCLEYRVRDDGQASITGLKEDEKEGNSLSLVIPSYLDGRTVASIDQDAFRDCQRLLSVTVQSSIKEIGADAFLGCYNLESIYVNHKDLAAYFTQKVTDSIGYHVSIYIEDKKYISSSEYTDSTGTYAYGMLSDGTAVITEYLGSETDVVIPEVLDGLTVTAIGNRAFIAVQKENNQNIQKVTLPKTIKAIHDSAFYFCSFESIILNEGLESIGNSAFAWTTKLNRVKFPSTLKTIGSSAFSISQVTEPEFSEGLEEIGARAFSDIDGLREIQIPSTVKKLGSEDTLAFVNLPDLKDVTVAEDCKSYMSKDGVLYSKDGKTLILFPQAKGKKYEVPAGVEKLGNDSFRTSTFKNGIGGWEVYSEGAEEIILPDSIKEISDTALTGDHSLKSVTVSAENPFFSSTEGVLYSADIRKLCVYPCQKEGENFTVPASVTEIGYRAFPENNYLTALTLPEGLAKIGAKAFECFQINEITVPANVSEIGENAFNNCGYADNDGENFTIFCNENTCAHKYAYMNGINFHLLDAKNPYKVPTEEDAEPVPSSAAVSSSMPVPAESTVPEKPDIIETPAPTDIPVPSGSEKPPVGLVSPFPAAVPGVTVQPQETEKPESAADSPTKLSLKNKKKYKQSARVKVRDEDGIKSIKINGRTVKIKKRTKSISFKLKKYKRFLKKKRWNKLVVTDVYGKKKTVRFKIK